MEISLGLQGPLIQFFLHKFGSSSGAIRFSLPLFRARSRFGLFYIECFKSSPELLFSTCKINPLSVRLVLSSPRP